VTARNLNIHNNTPIRGVCCIDHMILPAVQRYESGMSISHTNPP
jgi:hypothetical protein